MSKTMRRTLVFTYVVAAVVIILLSVGTIPSALATPDEEEQNKDNNVMLKIGHMLMTGSNYTIPTPVFWYQNSSWLNGLEK